MKLGKLFPAAVSGDQAERDVMGITSDSRQVKPGFVFVAVSGVKVDGVEFIGEAVSRGAIAILADAERPSIVPSNIIYVRVPDPRRILSLIAATLHGSQPRTIVAITGTAGKTSVADFVRQIYIALGHPAASIGTIGIVTPNGAAYGSLTTPDPVALHSTMNRLAQAGTTHLAIEASSHGLDQRRLDGVRISAAAFTNLGRDHLDYHATIQEYLAAKMRLFDTLMKPDQPVVINADGDYSADAIATAFARDLRIFSVGQGGLDLRLRKVKRENFNQALTLEYAGETFKVKLPLVGDFQAGNALVAAGLAIVTGCEPHATIAALEGLKGVKGRLEHVGSVNGAPVFVDYAHKPEALSHALAALQPFTKGRLIVVFGCGGDRDTGKRPIMGRIAADQANMVIVTDDNPRSEDPASIRAAILAAAPGAIEIGDRAEAIRFAIAQMGPKDCLVIAGKGHETGQIIGNETLPFSDQDVAIAAIAEVRQNVPETVSPKAEAEEILDLARFEKKELGSPVKTVSVVNASVANALVAKAKPADVPNLWAGEALAPILNSRIAGYIPDHIGGVSIDTRTLQAGDLFVAIKGDSLDGHDYVERAFDAGAFAAIVSEEQALRFSGKFADRGALYIVDDTLIAMQQMGIASRARNKGRILAVTGSVGKTSTKEALLHCLSRQGKTHASVASYNNHWGVPLTLARMPEATEFGIFEIGMSHAGEIVPLSGYVRPQVAMITTVEAVHIENFASIEGIADAKGEIFSGLEAGGVAILPRDNPHYKRLMGHAKRSKAQEIVSFGEHEKADVRLVKLALRPDMSTVEAIVHGQPITYKIGAPGRHMVMNSLGILAAVKALGGDIALAGLSLASFTPTVGRGARIQLTAGEGNITLLDESYNANPASMRAALDVLGRAELVKGGRRIAVLGDMLELGADSQSLHEGLQDAAIASGVDLIFACGPMTKHLFDRLPKSMRGKYAADSELLEPMILNAVQAGDVIMVKGSNGSRMGRIVKAFKTQFPEVAAEAAISDEG